MRVDYIIVLLSMACVITTLCVKVYKQQQVIKDLVQLIEVEIVK